ncbi:hypothetical protein CRG98_020600 [Punica granatum]|uniref:Uncharacterized protein n=2 Tax=Punica granatum TaxID=22663 RepID=A0A2I0JRW7_PUNGR|nr:hypothetical protein CRG98_020600 [Punica granatum]
MEFDIVGSHILSDSNIANSHRVHSPIEGLGVSEAELTWPLTVREREKISWGEAVEVMHVELPNSISIFDRCKAAAMHGVNGGVGPVGGGGGMRKTTKGNGGGSSLTYSVFSFSDRKSRAPCLYSIPANKCENTDSPRIDHENLIILQYFRPDSLRVFGIHRNIEDREMWGCRGCGGLVAAALLLLMAADDVKRHVLGSARELRPSDHGLAYQGSPPAGQQSPPEMVTFFGASSSSSPSSASAPHPPSVALPRAMNSSDAALWSQQQQPEQQQQEKPPSSSSRSRSSDRAMKEGLLIGSLVCGISGVALLAASAFIFLFFTAKKPNSPLPPTSSASAAHPPSPPHDHNNAVSCVPPAT